VVQLGQQRHPVAGQPVDQVHLPQRPRPVQRVRGQPGDLLGQLPLVARVGQGELTHVEVEVDLAVDPTRPNTWRRGPERPGR
jgi:hypothetical protein